MENRVPTKPGRIKLTDDSGNVKYYYMERADEPTVEGTPLNKATLFDSENESRYACALPSDALKMLTKEWQVNVLAANWSANKNADGYYTQTVVVSGMKSVYQPNFMPLYGTAATVDTVDEVFSSIKRMTTSNGNVTFMATEVPENDITIRVWRV